MDRTLALFTCAMCLTACADAGASKTLGSADRGSNAAVGGNDVSPNLDPGDFVEVEDEFEFAHPAVVGAEVFVANSSLNTVAVIDSRTLAIKTLPVGFQPTVIAGPADADAQGSAIFVLNKGSSTVSIVDPHTSAITSVDGQGGINALAASPNGQWAIAWYDAAAADASDRTGDLAAATLVRATGEAFQLAVGFRIERVRFVGNDVALLLTDDGVSVVRVGEVDDDRLVAPVAVVPPELATVDQSDREVVLDPNGAWAIARVGTYTGLILTDMASGEQWRVPTAARISDLDWVPGENEPRVLVTMRRDSIAFVATVPQGLQELAASAPMLADMGGDTGSADMGGDMADAATPDADMDVADADMADVDANDVDAAADAAPDMEPDAMLPDPVPGVAYFFLALQAGAAEVSADGSRALMFTTDASQRRAVLIDMGSLEQRLVAFEKGIRGALSSDTGNTFVVLHSRDEQAQPPLGASPSDPAFIAASWGLSIVDVASATSRLVLTEQKPGVVTLWKDAAGEQLFMIFDGDGDAESLRDVLQINLQSFSTSTFRVPSLPEGLGRVDSAGRIFVNQAHPQGRLTFVEVADGKRQTVTGYQLNAGID